MSSIKNLSERALLVILDGYGIRENSLKNAVANAKTPNLDEIFKHYPYTTIKSSGLSVGLPPGLPGNSEVGHLNMGAGKLIRQDLVRINESIRDDSLKDLDLIKELIKKAQANSKRVHLVGLLSDGGVHSHINHIKEMIRILGNQEHGLDVFFHAFMDGRDTPRDSGADFAQELIDDCKNFFFGSMQGRYWGMDRDKNFDRIEKAYNMFIGKGEIRKDVTPTEYMKEQYSKEVYDEFVEPVLFSENCKINSSDCIFLLNFRPDRAIQITQTFNLESFTHFERPVLPSYYLCMTPYIADEMKLPVLFDKENLTGGLSSYMSSQGVNQFKIAETEKYAHVTYFFNGGKKDAYDKEERKLIPSPKDVKTYDQKPEMSALEVTDALLTALDSNEFTFYTVNFANSDMVGHTGVFEAAVKAVETLDTCVAKLKEKCLEKGITMVITSDHGNSDQMEYENGEPHTSHTASDVPFCIIHNSLKDSSFEANGNIEDFSLKDVAPSVLYTMGIDIPENFNGTNIFK